MKNIVHKQLMEALVSLRPLNAAKLQELAGVVPIGEDEPQDADQPAEPQEPEADGVGAIEGTERLNYLVETYSLAEILDKIAEIYQNQNEMSASKLARKYAANFRKYLGLDTEN